MQCHSSKNLVQKLTSQKQIENSAQIFCDSKNTSQKSHNGHKNNLQTWLTTIVDEEDEADNNNDDDDDDDDD